MKTIAICTVIAASLGFQLVRSAIPSAAPPEPAGKAAAHAENVPEYIAYAAGHVEGRDRETSMRFELSGRLVAIQVAEGDFVRKGEVLARLNSETLKRELAIAQAALQLVRARERIANGAREETRQVAAARITVAEAALEPTRRNLARAEKLAKARAVSQETLDSRRGELETAEAEYKLAVAQAAEIQAAARADELLIADAEISLQQAKLDEIQQRLAKTELRAPFDGTVARVNATVGELVGPIDVEPLITMVDGSQLRVRAYVDELDALRVRPGMTAFIKADGLPEMKFRGTVRSCAPWMTPKSNTTNEADERLDVKMREVIILLEPQDALSQLVIGLPVEVVFCQSGLEVEADVTTSPNSKGDKNAWPQRLADGLPAEAVRSDAL